MVVRLQHSRVGGDEYILVLRQLAQPVHHDGGGVAAGFNDDAGAHAVLAGGGHNAGTGADGVQVGELVPHGVNGGGAGDQPAQGVGHDPALDLGAPFGLLGAAAVELEVEAIFDDRLIAAPAQGHLGGQRGELQKLCKVGVHADADGHGGGQAVGGVDLAHRVQQGELGLL